jgi:RimJ/RimL family protein N-acetyltransferase
MIEIISCKIVTLRPETLKDRKPIFDWLTNSDITKNMMGPPDFPDSPIPTWEQFVIDYKKHFLDSSKPLLGRCFVIEVNSEPVGQINHDKINQADHSTELDIWLKSSKYINKGYGTDAINTLCDYLTNKFKCKKFIIAPSKRNFLAIRAYEKAGFNITNEIHQGFLPDYYDTVLMIRTIIEYTSSINTADDFDNDHRIFDPTMNLHPDTSTCPQYKSCTVIDFWLRNSAGRGATLLQYP